MVFHELVQQISVSILSNWQEALCSSSGIQNANSEAFMQKYLISYLGAIGI